MEIRYIVSTQKCVCTFGASIVSVCTISANG